jgi:DNA-binding SARP family transcriptional activator
VRIGILGGWRVEHDGEPVGITGAMQRALLFRLALAPGSQLGYRAIAEDVWPDDPPENARAALQSLVSRQRTQLPEGLLVSTPGGYRLEAARADVDAIADTARADGTLRVGPRDAGPVVGYFCIVEDPDRNWVEFSFGQPINPRDLPRRQ